MQPWYESWFDSPYYHILYSHRDDKEAALFIENLVNHLRLQKNDRILDLGCGKGRHSQQFYRLGFDVTGVDLSNNSINYCKQFENERLTFYVHDMRELFRINYFDAVFNLFTSFGYFKTEHDNQLAINSAAKSIKPGGVFVLDYLNAEQACRQMKPHYEMEVEGIKFSIDKKIENGYFIKDIHFSDQGKKFEFNERVQMLDLPGFEKYFKKAGLEIKSIFGSYQLTEFSKETSDRLILVAYKSGV